MTQIDTRGEGGSKTVQKINTYYLNGPLDKMTMTHVLSLRIMFLNKNKHIHNA
jgi:hypothetical protein